MIVQLKHSKFAQTKDVFRYRSQKLSSQRKASRNEDDARNLKSALKVISQAIRGLALNNLV